MINVMTTVPQIAGKTPPSVFASRGSSSKNSPQREPYTPSLPSTLSRLAGKMRTISSQLTIRSGVTRHTRPLLAETSLPLNTASSTGVLSTGVLSADVLSEGVASSATDAGSDDG